MQINLLEVIDPQNFRYIKLFNHVFLEMNEFIKIFCDIIDIKS